MFFSKLRDEDDVILAIKAESNKPSLSQEEKLNALNKIDDSLLNKPSDPQQPNRRVVSDSLVKEQSKEQAEYEEFLERRKKQLSSERAVSKVNFNRSIRCCKKKMEQVFELGKQLAIKMSPPREDDEQFGFPFDDGWKCILF